jgi:hypothetical protein
VAGDGLEAWSAEPVRELSLFARRTLRVEPFDPGAHQQGRGDST